MIYYNTIYYPLCYQVGVRPRQTRCNSCTGFDIISTTYVSNKHTVITYCVLETLAQGASM